METTDVAALKSSQVAALSTDQIALGLTTDQVVALTTGQFQALTTGQLAALSTYQISKMETVDLVALKTSQIAALSTDQIVSGLTTDEVVALTTGQIQALTTGQVAALSTYQVSKMETADVVALKTSQLSALSTQQINAGLTTDQLISLKTNQIAALSTDQIALGLSTDQVVALSTSQFQTLSTSQLRALTTYQVSKMETTDLAALKTSQIAALTTDQINQGLTTTQVAALTTMQVEAFTSAQIAAFTTTQFQQLQLGTPIVLDLSGNGITTQSIENGTRFDLFATGQAVNTGWVTSGEGLLVLDRNHDGIINDGSELFGSSTTLASGEKASNGYAALGEMDTNGDGVITSADKGWSDLRVWVDANGDGVSQADELKSLDSLHITKLDLNATASTEKSNGNILGLTSSYETSDGSSHAMADVWFVADKNAATATTTPAEDLRSKVGSLVQAMSSFDSTQSNTGSSASQLPVTGNTPAVASVGGIVDVLQKFDANGNPLGATPLAQTATPAPSLTNTPSLTNPVNTGILTTSGK
jgi:hypothetical protein